MDNDTVIVISSGYFNPIHRGHIEALSLAKNLYANSHHIVIINNEEQAILKKGRVIVPLEDRVSVVKELRSVDEVFISVDYDRSVCKSIEVIARKYEGKKILFAKGGDRTSDEIPEAEVCKKYNIQIIDGLGKKVQSSSEIVKNMNNSC